MTTQQYFSKHWGQASVVWDLYESIAQAKQDSSQENSSSRGKGPYAPHWSATAVEQGISAGEVVQV